MAASSPDVAAQWLSNRVHQMYPIRSNEIIIIILLLDIIIIIIRIIIIINMINSGLQLQKVEYSVEG